MPELIRLPLSSRRRAQSFAKLVRRVNFDAEDGFGWEGKLLKAGSTLPSWELRPDASWPENPVLLECAGHDLPGWGHRRTPATYILWVHEHGAWREAARSQAVAAEWAVELRPVAMRLVHGDRRDAVQSGSAAKRICELLERELEGLSSEQRQQVLSAAHDQFAARLAGDGWKLAMAG